MLFELDNENLDKVDWPANMYEYFFAYVTIANNFHLNAPKFLCVLFSMILSYMVGLATKIPLT